MFNKLRFPLVYVFELILFIPLFAGFFGLMSFVASVPIQEIKLNGKLLPSSWEAAVPNHGGFTRGYLITEHPVAFFLVVLACIGSGFLTYKLRQAQAWQRQQADSHQIQRHKIANAATFAGFGISGYLFISRVIGHFTVF